MEIILSLIAIALSAMNVTLCILEYKNRLHPTPPIQLKIEAALCILEYTKEPALQTLPAQPKSEEPVFLITMQINCIIII